MSRCVVLKKWVAEEGLRHRALLVVDGEARLEYLAEVRMLFDQVKAVRVKVSKGIIQRRFTLEDFDACCQLVLDVVERLITRRELQKEAGEAPDVRLEAEAPVKLLRWHVSHRTGGRRRRLVPSLLQLIAHAQIDEFDAIALRRREQHILRLQVLMDDLAVVQVLDATDQLAADVLDDIDVLRTALLLQIEVHIAALEQLHDDVTVVELIDRIKRAHEVLV